MYLNQTRSVLCLIALGLAVSSGRAQDLKLDLQIDHHQPEFRIGEPIHMQLAFTASVPDTYGVQGRMPQRRYEPGLEEVAISPADGWVDPWMGYRKATSGTFPGGGPNSYGLLSSKPSQITLRLDEYVTFRKPGHYTVEVTSTRVSRADAGPTPEPVRLVSNSVNLTILPATQEWQEERLQHALAVLNGGAGSPSDEAYQWLQTLDTRAAATAMISLTASDGHPAAEYFLGNGLIKSSHRQYVIKSMQQKITEPGFAVRSYFLGTLAELMALEDGTSLHFQRRKAEIRRQLEEQTLTALPRKQVSAKAVTLSTLIDGITSSWPGHGDEGAAQLLAMASGVLTQLTESAQYGLLSARWDAVKGPAMIPALQAYLQGPKPRECDELALRRLAELSPGDARTIILADAVRPGPRFSARALGILPDEQLPELDGVLAANLHHDGADLDRMAALIQRYASPAILPQVVAFYEGVAVGHWACTIEDSLLAYTLRVDPAVGMGRVRDALAAREVTGCYKTLLFDLAQQQPAAELQPLAIVALDDPDPWVVVTAANALAIVGDASAKEALFERFRRWHQTWAGRENELRPRPGRDVFESDAPLGEAILRALVGANNWLLADAEAERAANLLLGEQAREQASYVLAAFRARPVPLSLNGDAMYPALSVGGYVCRNLESLKHKLDQYPVGTVFESPSPNSTSRFIVEDLSAYLAVRGKRMVFVKSQTQ